MEAQMQDWLKQAKSANFGAAQSTYQGAVGGVNYASATAGSQVYNASTLVSR